MPGVQALAKVTAYMAWETVRHGLPSSSNTTLASKAAIWLKTSRIEPLLNELQSNLESADAPEDMAPIRQCWRYLSARQDQLDYESAIAQGLPIGSGEIQSAHRYIVQKTHEAPRCLVEPRKCRAYARAQSVPR